MLLAAGVTFVLDSARQSFNLLMSIGAGTGLIYLLRWFWWRINAWSEIAAMASSFIVSIAFFLAQKRGAVIDASTVLLVTIAATTVTWVVATYLTKPTNDATLERFYRLVRPPGPGWRAVRERAQLSASPDSLAWSVLAWVLGCVFVYAALFGSGSLLYGRWLAASVWLVLFAVSGVWLVRLLRPRVTKAVILARGLGTRMRAADANASLSPEQAAAADAGMKAMITIDRPFLDYVLSALAEAGFTEVCLVVGPEHTAIREYYDGKVSFAIQAEPLGTADAVLAAAPFIGEDLFVVLNSDNYYPVEVLRELRTARAPALPAFDREVLVRESNIAPERIARYALLDIGDDGYLQRVIEKPERDTGEPVSMNVWLLTPEIFEACQRVPLSPRGERELPGAVQWAIDNLGMRVQVLPVRAGVLDLSQRADIPAVAERLRGTVVRL